MTASDQVRAHVYISGLVQGVSFRYYTRQEAQRHGVSGWVRNLPDDRVEAVFEGDKAAVQQMIEWCREGPPSADVENVQVTWEEPTRADRGFSVRH
jgi:acylphosphatase